MKGELQRVKSVQLASMVTVDEGVGVTGGKEGQKWDSANAPSDAATHSEARSLGFIAG